MMVSSTAFELQSSRLILTSSLNFFSELADKASAASWISVAILPLCIFLLVSYAVLPVKFTHRHYLGICFTLGICFMEVRCCIEGSQNVLLTDMQLAFIIPLGTKPEQCYNEITPNDMHSSLSCAFTGALLLFGGWMVIVWSMLGSILSLCGLTRTNDC